MILHKELSIEGVFSYFHKDFTLINVIMESIVGFNIITDENKSAIELRIYQGDDGDSFYTIKDENTIDKFISEFTNYKKNLSLGNLY